MLSVLCSHAPVGLEGVVIRVEVDIRRGLPGTTVVGLPDGAVREARERVRVAIRNSGFRFPAERILINLAPAGIRKEGAAYDLAIALAILGASAQVPLPGKKDVMVLGELNLAGQVRAVRGVLPAVGRGLEAGVEVFLVPQANLREARALGRGRVFGIDSLQAASELLAGLGQGREPPRRPEGAASPPAVASPWGDLQDIKGQHTLRRALEITAAGRHHLLLFGPPGSGKTMAARRLPSLLPDLSWAESLAVTRIHSVAGVLPPESGLVTRPPIRMPHHSASSEGVVGGGGVPRPGEVSLAHEGVLILDEAAEFRLSLLQSLREPMEAGQITIARAGLSVRFPACSQLVFTTNPCPCGNLGRKKAVCVCSHQEIARYWKRLGGALLDRVDIRVPLVPLDAAAISGPPGESSREVLERVCRSVERQRSRYAGLPFSRNGWLPPAAVEEFCPLEPEAARKLAEATEELALSSRAHQSIRKVARTVADLDGSEAIRAPHVLEAVQHRRFGGADLYWSFA